jgi:hypothetical protein
LSLQTEAGRDITGLGLKTSGRGFGRMGALLALWSRTMAKALGVSFE